MDENKNIFKKFSDFFNATKFRKEIWSWFKTIVGAVILAWIIKTFIIVNAVVPTSSMETTIMPNDRLIAFRLSYLMSEPERFDIIVFKYPDDKDTLYVKRIIGMPGEQVDIVDGKVYINAQEEMLGKTFNGIKIDSVDIGEEKVYIKDNTGNAVEVETGVIFRELLTPLDDSFIKEVMKIDMNRHYDVPSGHYFMLGDNRNDSWDSRYWKNTFVPKEDILGEAVFKYWPDFEMLMDK